MKWPSPLPHGAPPVRTTLLGAWKVKLTLAPHKPTLGPRSVGGAFLAKYTFAPSAIPTSRVHNALFGLINGPLIYVAFLA